MGHDLDLETFHHTPEDRRLRNRSIVEIKRVWNALKSIILTGFAGHRIEQETKRRFDVFAVDATTFLIRDAGTDHRRRRTASGLARLAGPHRSKAALSTVSDRTGLVSNCQRALDCSA